MIHDFKCGECGTIAIDVHLPMDHADADHPMCCNAYMRHYHTQAPYVAWEDRHLLDGGFKANHDGTVITSHKQNKDYMKRHGLLNAMDLGPPPTHLDDAESNKKSQEAIDAITPTDAQMTRMKEDGTMAKIEQMME
ncbi:MAG: hypothetical protein DRH90_22525 [Deltaproteobacteria bacterium]|nr:MAG: hypothetical protein DRH90_22525 [Deltaproteobacteria bacterium]RLC13975.1 MAG: hypothetical protein DRI24_14540 [Deltaproteobacteria bacterium]